MLVSDLTYIRNINITLKVAEWDMGAAHGSAELPSGLIKKIKSLLNIKNKDNMCFAYCIAAYLLRREAAARRAREVGVSATQAAPTPSDEPPIPANLVGLAEHVTQLLQYNAAIAANPDAASSLTPPPIWPPVKPSLAPPTDLEGPEEPGFSDETDATTVFENDGVVYPESNARNPFGSAHWPLEQV